jgi:hypothetical protein
VLGRLGCDGIEQIGMEGIANKVDVPYKAGRTQVWRKVKTPKEIEAKRLQRLSSIVMSARVSGSEDQRNNPD